jgi:alkanesulfonate monooxygenase SsuD/methylene tetrahydromethanopterin reductase-like flavin-dependent oxidoreductase (luciferase family)
VVARHADVWNVNLPPIPERVAAAAGRLEQACAEIDRDPQAIRRHQWIFTRIQERPDPSGALAEFRRLNPWFGDLTDREVASSLVIGGPETCRRRLGEIARELAIDLPVLDLSGVDADTARRNLDAIPPGA